LSVLNLVSDFVKYNHPIVHNYIFWETIRFLFLWAELNQIGHGLNFRVNIMFAFLFREIVREIVSRVDAQFSYRTENCIPIRFVANCTLIRTGNHLRVDGPLEL
jgi:hypothetical protein